MEPASFIYVGNINPPVGLYTINTNNLFDYTVYFKTFVMFKYRVTENGIITDLLYRYQICK